MATDTLACPPLPDLYAPSRSTYAGFWIRALAFSLDAAVISLCTAWLPPALALVSFCLPFAYFAFFWSRLGGSATPFMRLFGLHVVGPTGDAIGLPQALLRALVLPFCFLVFYVGVIWVAFSPTKQGWHDYAASTCVVRG